MTEDALKTPLQEEVEYWKRHAEEHAYSVRQLIAQRARHFEAFKLAGRVAAFHNEQKDVGAFDFLKSLGQKRSNVARSQLSRVLDAIELSPSQFLQDIFCLLLNGGKNEGFFVEFGACDGLLIDNTVLLEREFGWKGILSEPSPHWYEQLRNNRKCAIETRCIWSESGKFVPFGEIADMTQSTVLVSNPDAPDNVEKQYDVETISLFDLLRHHDAPKHIDMLSIDTEGTEFEILNAFPFSAYSFGFMCIEHRHERQETEIKKLLESVGYKQILRTISGHDGFYVPASTPYV